jgi:restriction system protein
MRQNATKGVFITSGRFTDGARHAATQAKVKIRLIDGEELARLMMDHGVGVNAVRTLSLVKIDADFFDELG